MQSVSARLPWSEAAIDLSVSTGQLFLRPLQVLMAAPSLLFLGALTAMLLRHPDVAFYEIDRVAFGLLVVGVVGRGVILRQRLLFVERVTWPMIGLMALALVSVTGQPYDHETWSLLGSKLIVPLALFHLAGLVFTNERHFRQFEIFALIVLAYLSFTAIAFLCGAHSLIFPRFILDSSLGFHASRARGPLLQAVANGVSLNMLGLLALHAYRRGSVRKLKLAVLSGHAACGDPCHDDAVGVAVLCWKCHRARPSIEEPPFKETRTAARLLCLGLDGRCWTGSDSEFG